MVLRGNHFFVPALKPVAFLAKARVYKVEVVFTAVALYY